MGRKYFQGQVVETLELSPLVKHVVFKKADGQNMPYKGGQFIMIHFEGREGVEIKRSYSIASLPEGDCEHFALCVKLVEEGQGSTLIHSLNAGDEVKMSGPYGRFNLANELPDNVILAATGTGVAPFRSMKLDLRRALEEGKRVALLFGCRHCDELLYRDEWESFAKEHPNFSYHAIVSRPGEEDKWPGPVGYVQHFLDHECNDMTSADTMAYLCGVPQMIDSVRNTLTERGFDIRQIRTEKFASPPPPRPKA